MQSDDETAGALGSTAAVGDGRRHEAPLWRFVEDWPQVPRHIRSTLDARLIPLHAVAVLRRSLDEGRVMAFLGSGVSMAYGRLGWGELIRWMADNAAQSLEQKAEPGHQPIDVLRERTTVHGSRSVSAPRPATSERMRGLLKELEINRPRGGDDMQSGRFPAAFQFLERIAIELESTGLGHTRHAESRVRRAIRALLRDDAGHSYLLLDELLSDLSKASTPFGQDVANEADLTLKQRWAELHSYVEKSLDPHNEVWKQPLDNDPQRYAWRSMYELHETYAALTEAANGMNLPARVVANILAAAFGGGQGSRTLPPLHRFIVPALFRLDPDLTHRLLLQPRKSGARLPQNLRHLCLPEGRDPLLLLLRDLGIHRYATTNYDLDIEQMVRDRGFDFPRGGSSAPAGTARALSRNAFGVAAHDSVFRQERAAELLRFANDRSRSIQLMHLHGRVLPAEPLVVTERDYQDMYLRRGDTAEAAHDAIALAFRSNTVLFLGSGMSEDDILRPMRQFVTERKSMSDRSGVVLLPADGTRAREIEEIIALYSRYGVLTKHFGLGELRAPEKDALGYPAQGQASPAQPPVRWLAGLLSTRKLLKDLLDKLDSVLTDRSSEARGWKDEDWGPLLQPLREGPENKLASSDAERWLATTLPTHINGCDVEQLLRALRLGPSFHDLPEVALLRTVAQALVDLLQPEAAGPVPWLEPLGVLAARPTEWPLKALLALPAPVPLQVTRRLLHALLAILKNLDAALRGLAMMLELASIHLGWLHWKRRRAERPEIRPVGAHRDKPVSDDLPHTLLFHRNLLALRPKPPEAAVAKGQTGDRFIKGAPSNSFHIFVAALQSRAPALHRTAPAAEVGTRRLFLLLASRGVGKGHFFEVMAERERMRLFLQSSWQAEGRHWNISTTRTIPHPNYAVCCYVNLGLSLEFLSAFDRLSLVLVERAPIVFPAEPNDPAQNLAWRIRQTAFALAHNRLACLQAILRLYAENQHRARARVLIAFNGFGQFYDRLGAPKNAHLHRLIEALIGPETTAVPIDVLMVCQETDLPGRFKRDGLRLPIARNTDLDGWSTRPEELPHHHLVHLLEPRPSERVRSRLRQFLQRLNLEPQHPAAGRSEWMHVLRGAHALATISKYFPAVALSLAMDAVADAPGTPPLDGALPTRLRPITTHPAEMRRLQEKILLDVQPPEQADQQLQRLLHVLAMHVLANHALPKDLNAPAFEPAQLAEAASQPGMSDIDERFLKLHKHMRGSRYLLSIVCAAASERGWQRSGPDARLHFVPGLALQWLETVGLDAADHLPEDAIDRIIAKTLLSHQDSHDRDQVPPGWESMHQPTPGAGLVQLAASIKDLLHTPWLGKRPGPAFAQHRLQTFATLEDSRQWMAQVLCGPLGWRLQQRLLWHMAVMGMEVQADVLATAPLVEADCTLLVGVLIGMAGDELRIDDLRQLNIPQLLVGLMLDLMVNRCLVFRMWPVELGPEEVRSFRGGASASKPASFDDWFEQTYNPERAPKRRTEPDKTVADDDGRESSGWRYTIHRFLQRNILEHLKAPFVEFPKVDQFGLSLWVSQPDELPRPNRSDAHDISNLVAAWIGFPTNAESLRATSTYHWYLNQAQARAKDLMPAAAVRKTEAPQGPRRPAERESATLAVTRPSRMLRAALGVLRTTYSVGVVSRFHGFDDDGNGLAGPEEGYFKQHHLQVRWLLEQAKNLRCDKDLAALVQRSTETEDLRDTYWGVTMEAVAPFYVDELVWLNNECGLFCLVEGRLENAAGMFRQALVTASLVEGEDPQGALSCRVHLNLAMVDIERGRIREADEHLARIENVRDENPVLRILARGFRALVEHLSGNLSRAETVYVAVIEDLGHLGQLRAVAIFSRHLAELYRLQGASAAAQALRAIEQSIAAATKGGHEDIRHLAMLSRVRLAIAGVLPAKLLVEAHASTQGDLDAIEHYGHVMGMPRLLADVAFARALSLLNLGETRHAAHLAHKCLEICAVSGLRLRQMLAMALLGRIYRKRGRPDLAQPLFSQAYAIAADCHYGNLREVVFDRAADASAGL